MADETTRRVLADARRRILEPLKHSSDINTKGAWIPSLNMIPEQDMHISIAFPWWWHTIRPGNDNLSRSMARRFKQTLLLKFHHPFQVELERIILLGGKVIVALWRCIGHRTTEDGDIVQDRHGENIDPMVRLREEIIRCFVYESPDQRLKPLTYQHRMRSESDDFLERQHTIKQRTPGMGVTADGFIHMTLCRLPVECLSSHDVDLEKIHRLCREATATLNGHRMVIGKFRFIETVGAGGDSNPCHKPLYDETIDAPVRHKVEIDGTITERKPFNSHTVDEHLTIGPANNFLGHAVGVDTADGSERSLQTSNSSSLTQLFQPPE
ncbi:hypothetical protein ACHAWF_006052 [Thalassiosira exigua]